VLIIAAGEHMHQPQGSALLCRRELFSRTVMLTPLHLVVFRSNQLLKPAHRTLCALSIMDDQAKSPVTAPGRQILVVVTRPVKKKSDKGEHALINL
jgi:hypothetical protein